MSGVDIVIGLIFLISIIVGIMRGLIKEALSIAGWILAIWLAASFKVEAGELFSQYINIPNATFRSWIGFTLVFVLTLFGFSLVSYMITRLLVRGPIKGIDRFLGIFFGAARATLIVVGLLIVGRGLGMAESQWWQQSQLLPTFIPAVEAIEPIVFDNLPSTAETEASLEQKLINQAVENLSESSLSVDGDQPKNQ